MSPRPKVKYPFADTSMAKFLAKRIDQVKPDLTQREIAHRMGYRCVNFISMFKTGAARVPFDKIPVLAEILEVDPAHLVRLGLEHYWPELTVVSKVLPAPVTENEMVLLSLVRKATNNADSRLTDAQKTVLERILSSKSEACARTDPA